MALSVRPRCSFTPEALIKFSVVFDERLEGARQGGSVRAFNGRTRSAHAAGQEGVFAGALAVDRHSDQATARAGLPQRLGAGPAHSVRHWPRSSPSS